MSDAPLTAKSPEQPPAPKPRGVWGQLVGLTAALLRVLNRLAESGWSGTAAAAWALLQSSVVPGPSDAVLIPLGLADPRKAIPLALWTIAGSAVGAMIGYGIGVLAYDSIGLPLLTWLGVTSSHLAHVSALMREKGWLVVALGSLPLLSSKVAAIIAGAFGMPAGEFVLVTLVVRGGRFLVEGLLLRFAGGWVKRWVSRRDGRLVP